MKSKQTATITIANNKGGVGKTTATINLSAGLRNRGYNVLAVDLDGQSNLTRALTGERGSQPTIYEAVVNPAEIANLNPQVVKSREGDKGEIHLISSSRDLFAGSLELAEATDRLDRLARVLDRFKGKYDFILIDTTPAIDLITINALRVADLVIVPTIPHYLSLWGTIDLIVSLKEIKGEENVDARVLLMQYNARNTSHKMVENILNEWRQPMFKTKVRTNIAVAEAPAVREDIYTYAPKSNGAKDYNALTEELVEWYEHS